MPEDGSRQLSVFPFWSPTTVCFRSSAFSFYTTPWPREAKGPWCCRDLPIKDRREVCSTLHPRLWHGHGYVDGHLQYSSDWHSQWDTRQIPPNQEALGHKKAYVLVQDLTGTKQERTTTIQDKGGTCLTEIEYILKRWTEYCSELYNYRATGDPEVLNVPPATNDADHPSLREEVEAEVKSLKKGQSAGVDNISAELLQQGGEAMVNALLIICNKIWWTGDWPTPWTQSLVITLPKNGNLQLCQNYRTISLISHPSKVMLKIILNCLKLEVEKIIAEKQAGFRPGRSTIEQIFNLRILCER